MPSYFACMSATILVLHAFTSLAARWRYKPASQSPLSAFKAINVSVSNGNAVEEKTFVELHGGLVLFSFKITRLLSSLVFLVLSLATLRVDRDAGCGISRMDSFMIYFWSSGPGVSASNWIQLSLCATSVRRSAYLSTLLF